MGIAAAALSGLQGQLEVGVMAAPLGHGGDRLVGQDGAAKIGVDDHARGIDDPTEMRPGLEAHIGLGSPNQGGKGQSALIRDHTGADFLSAQVEKLGDQVL